LPEDFAQRVYLIAKEKLSPPPVVVHEIIQISSTSSNGLEVIKQIFTPITATDHEGSKTSIKYVSAPNYRLSVTAANYKIAERNLKRINETIQKEAKKLKCTVLIQRI
jgi:translation initiation factor 2 alpha subunit (eIF-2alpha)